MSKVTSKGFIFDVDATLVDTSLVINNIWKRWSSQKDINFSEVFPHVHGRKIIETLTLLDPKYANIKEENTVKGIAVDAMKSATEIQGALNFVKSIPQQSWAIATSGPRKVAQTSLLASGFKLPEVMVCAEDVAYGKPHPEPFVLAAQKLGLEAQNCIAFEDSPAGVKSAKDAGCFTIALLTSHKKSELASADLIIDSFSMLTLRDKESFYELCW
ncbi:HAD-IA family hydrolase [Psychromonas aquimarina]|uniref:HAD-IA family hydrolase n=1 Tax=Psychromonas aquimarina TaxID=444919 RepID=UPI000429E3AD|nr:HAD-IA family hydrolase [Psychromonas aquimarina]